jgi:hypothetical protein
VVGEVGQLRILAAEKQPLCWVGWARMVAQWDKSLNEACSLQEILFFFVSSRI